MVLSLLHRKADNQYRQDTAVWAAVQSSPQPIGYAAPGTGKGRPPVGNQAVEQTLLAQQGQAVANGYPYGPYGQAPSVQYPTTVPYGYGSAYPGGYTYGGYGQPVASYAAPTYVGSPTYY
eukprot:TRINITY_DN74744_c0_g1_i1.p2 TRINITY_DN74744_c0_g1~~TRINITY_DN74744_c0_g1_i1.p2  ORF type:complete len:120 (-),score=11.83 TRINITY_DN74744_c0_g1_i1:219-578(-)